MLFTTYPFASCVPFVLCNIAVAHHKRMCNHHMLNMQCHMLNTQQHMDFASMQVISWLCRLARCPEMACWLTSISSESETSPNRQAWYSIRNHATCWYTTCYLHRLWDRCWHAAAVHCYLQISAFFSRMPGSQCNVCCSWQWHRCYQASLLTIQRWALSWDKIALHIHEMGFRIKAL